MKTTILLGILLFFILTLSAQESNFSFAKNDVHWVERSSQEKGPTNLEVINPDYELNHFSINGEQEINGVIYKKVFVNDEFYRYIRQDDNKIVYYRHKDQDYILYCFDWNNKEYLHATDIEGKDFVMEDLGSGNMILADGNTYPYVKVNYVSAHYSHSKDLRFIMGIGLTRDCLNI